MYSIKTILIFALLIFFSVEMNSNSYAQENSKDKDARMEWWRDARFGLFIHWGLYSIPAGEWNGKTNYAEWIRNNAEIPIKVYDKFVNEYNPVKFDARQWVKMAKDAGMKYIVITSKHHDGFCNFDSKYTDFDIMSTPFKRDVLKELADAAHQAGIKIGFYYSIMDWHNPNYLPRRPWETDRSAEGADFDTYVQYMKNQLHELLTNYGEVSVLWFDGEWENTWNNKYGKEIYDYVRKLQPKIIVNNRVSVGRNGLEGFSKDEEMIGDYGTPEQEIPATGISGVDWETCMTMNDHWGYNKRDNDWKSSKELIRMLADIASKGGNYLLNVGPTSEGVFPPAAVKRLKEIGDWMKINGESIYGTEASPFSELKWGRATMKQFGDESKLYLHVFDWPADCKITVPGILNKPKAAYLLSDPSKKALKVERNEDALIISLPSTAPDSLNSVVALDLIGKPDIYNPPIISASSNIFIDSLNVTLTSNNPKAVIRYTTDGSVPVSSSEIALNQIIITKSSTISARIFSNEMPLTSASEASFKKVSPNPSVSTDDLMPGINYSYFEGEWDALPDFDNMKPISSGIIKNIDVLHQNKQEDNYGFEFTGFIKIEAEGIYKFFTSSDDGSRLYIDDKMVVDNDGPHGLTEKDGVAALSKGLHKIKVTYFEATGSNDLFVSYKGPNIKKQIIPDSILFVEKK